MHSLLYCSKSYLLRKPVILALCLYMTQPGLLVLIPRLVGQFAWICICYGFAYANLPEYASVLFNL